MTREWEVNKKYLEPQKKIVHAMEKRLHYNDKEEK